MAYVDSPSCVKQKKPANAVLSVSNLNSPSSRDFHPIRQRAVAEIDWHRADLSGLSLGGFSFDGAF